MFRDLDGLTDAQAAMLRAESLANSPPLPSWRAYWEIVRRNLYPWINGVLAAVSLLLLAFGMVPAAVLTAGPVLLNVLTGAAQEAMARRRLDRLIGLARPRAIVVRAGVERDVDPSELVLGDVIVARRGDQIVLDGRLLSDDPAEIDESLLTGESDPVLKRRGDSVVSGSNVVSGTACYRVEAVGNASYVHGLLAQSAGLDDGRTPLQRDVTRIIWAVAGCVLATALSCLLAWRLATGNASPADLVSAMAVLVTMVPQGLAIMLTLAYTAGALQIGRAGVLVQRQSALESMARVDIMCLDKTGTLTTQALQLVGVAAVEGVDPVTVDQALRAVGASSSTSSRVTEAIAAAYPSAPETVADEVPFSSDRGWSALRLADGRTWLLGSPSRLVPAPPHDAAMRPTDDVAGRSRSAILARADELSSKGDRVVLLANAASGEDLRDGDGRARVPRSLQALALVRFKEQLRPGIDETVRDFQRAGIGLKVLSGDNPRTVAAVADRLGIGRSEEAVAGPSLDALNDEDLAAIVEHASVFGLLDPRLKARIVACLRHAGHHVAMIGDGVNDIPALRQANLGVATGSGSPATRGTADLVLLADDFGALTRAITTGQRIVAAMNATLVLLLSRTFSMLLIVGAASILMLPFPFTPLQNAVLALLTLGIPLNVVGILVPAQRPSARPLADSLRVAIPVAAALLLVGLPVYALALGHGHSIDESRTMLTSLLVLCGLGLLPLTAPPLHGFRVSPTQRAPWLLAAVMLVAYAVINAIPETRAFYELAPLRPADMVIPASVAAGWTGILHGIRSLVAGRRRSQR